MIGQGRPTCVRAITTGGWRCRLVVSSALHCLAVAACASAFAQDVVPTLGVRIAWGGGPARQWNAKVEFESGQPLSVRTLGVDPDEPASAWTDGGTVYLRSRSPRTFDGIDIELQASLDAEIVVSVESADVAQVGGAQATRLALRTLLNEPYHAALDEAGNRLSIRRRPGDALHVETPREALVFAPGERWSLAVEPRIWRGEGQARLRARMVSSAGGLETWSTETDVALPIADQAPPQQVLEVPVPDAEGVYQLELVLEKSGFRSRLRLNDELVRRSVQIVVVDRVAPVESTDSNVDLRIVDEIDPTASRWWDRLIDMPWVPGRRRSRLVGGDSRVTERGGRAAVQLDASESRGDAAWAAYPLAVRSPGEPHVVEVDYPADAPQSLGISIIEPNAAGTVTPIGLDSGVYIEEASPESSVPWQRHRLVFWPKTEEPLVLLHNMRSDRPALFSSIRLLAGPSRLAPLVVEPPHNAAGRMVAAYYDRPLFPENFSAPQTLDTWSGRCLDDWSTFYLGARRMVEYLSYAGYNALVLNVLSEGSTLYPSAVLDGSARYDTGAFFDDGYDPQQKDVLELVLRLSDRHQVSCFPGLQFTTPLPKLEGILRAGDERAVGIELVGADGRTFMKRHPPSAGQAPYYNLLDPRVQEAMLEVIREVAGRAASHRSFRGVAIDLTAEGFARLPGSAWGLDDRTMARFGHAAGLTLPDSRGPQRYMQRAAFVAQHEEAWLAWRARQVSDFYRRVHAEIERSRPGAQLLLLGSQMFESNELAAELVPALPRRANHDRALLLAGIDPRAYVDGGGRILLRPQIIGRNDDPHTWAPAVQCNHSQQLDRLFAAAAVPGSVVYHEPYKMRLPSFDSVSPFRDSYTWLVAQSSAGGAGTRRQFARALSSVDSQIIVNGGWLLPLGQEEARNDWLRVFRQLPAQKFEAVPGTPQPLVLRRAVVMGRTYVYAVNDSPWPLTMSLSLDISAATVIEEFGARSSATSLARNGDSAQWSRVLAPYGLAAIAIDSEQVTVGRAAIQVDEAGREQLARRIDDLGDRATSLARNVPIAAPANNSFEEPGALPGTAAGWTVGGTVADQVLVSNEGPFDGAHCLRVECQGQAGWAVSDPFPRPRTGRLSVAVWLRVDDPQRQPALRLGLESVNSTAEYYRYAPLGAQSTVAQVTDEWSEYIIPVTDLPADVTSLRIRFDISGPATVWIDKVQAYDLWFSDSERVELLKLITTADLRLENGEYADCLQLLAGYWPRFLEAYVAPPVETPQRHQVAAPAKSNEPEEGSRQGTRTFRERLNDLLPESLRLF